jgi:hypothetical protein
VFITYKEVRSYVERAEAGGIVGRCSDPRACLIAEAVRQKYPDTTSVLVSLDDKKHAVYISASTSHIYRQQVTTGDDETALFELADAFDRLDEMDTAIGRELALGLFQ